MPVDFHTHILPSIDDGSLSIEMSIEMLEREARQGINLVIATPHFYAHQDRPERFLEKRKKAYETLLEEMDKHSNLPRIILGAEVLYFGGIHQWEGLKDFTIGNSNYVLIEMPMPPWSKRMVEEIASIPTNLGLVPIMAHIDRYIKPFKTYGIPDTLSQLPVLIQVNTSFFLQRNTSRMAYRLLRENKIHLLGSDCHNLEHRPPNLGIALSKIERKLGKETLMVLEEYEKKVLKNI